MIEPLPDMPPGTIGLVATGDVTRAEYANVLAPTLRAAVESGAGLRLLFQVGPGFRAFEPGALLEDVKSGWDLGVRHHDAWERFALVTDVDWMAQAARMLAWATPGEVRVFALSDGDEARAWLAG
jgi:SpoIIAA-like